MTGKRQFMSRGKYHPYTGVPGLLAVVVLYAGCTCGTSTRGDSPRHDTATLYVQVLVRLLPGVALPDMPPPGEQPCAGAAIDVQDGEGRPLALGKSDNDGLFTTTVPAGRYRVSARCLDTEVQVRETTLRAGTSDTLRFLITAAAP